MRLDLLDYKIIKEFYCSENWNHNIFYLEDFKQFGVPEPTLRYHLKKLYNAGYIRIQKTYPIYYEPILSKSHRNKMEKLYNHALRGLL